MNIRLNCEKASDSSKNPKSPTLRAFSTPSATSFFFKANPKQILNTVKKVLSPSDIENENDSSEVTELKKGATGPEEEELLTLDRPYSSSDSPLAHEAIEITSDEDLRLDAGRKRPVVIDLSDEGEEDYSRKIPCARAARKKAFVSTEETLNAVGKRVATTGGKITIVKAPSSQEDIMPVVSTTSHLSSPEIDPLLLKYASPSKAAPPLTPAIALPLKRYKMTIHDDFPYHFGDRTKHVITRTLTSNDSIWAVYRRHCEEKRLSSHSVVLTYSNARIFKSATPASLGIATNSFTITALPETEYRRREGERIQKRALLLDALLAKDNLGPVDERPLINMGAPADQALSSPTLRISFRSSSCSSETWSAHIAVDQPLTRVLPDLCSAFGLATDATPRLFFDGTLLDPSKSPQQLQLEDDDLIDVCLAKK